MIFIKIVCLLSYFILVFLVVRILEFYLTSLAGSLSFVQQFYDILPSFESIIIGDSQLRKQSDHNTATSVYEEESDLKYEDVKESSSMKDFSNYDELLEHVEDTKTSIWIIRVYSVRAVKHSLSETGWKSLTKKLRKYGIKTAIYKCKHDPNLCTKLHIRTPTIVLSMPKGSQINGNVAFHVYEALDGSTSKQKIYDWIQSRLYPKVKTVHSLNELVETPVTRKKTLPQAQSIPSMSFIYHSESHTPPPLLLTALSVRFTGRVKFYLLKTKKSSSFGDTLALTDFLTYNYGSHKGENFNYSCMELFFRTVHPEVNDIFILTVVLINMACWLELFLQKGGPLQRLAFYFWGFILANFILVSIWLPIIQLIYIPQVQPYIQICLKSFQQMMLSNIAAVIRQDFLQLSQNLHFVFLGFIFYGAIIGYVHYKICRGSSERSGINSLTDLVESDIQELSEIFHSVLTYITPSLRVYRFEEHIERILNRLATPDLWLHPFHSLDYISELPRWMYCEKLTDESFSSSCMSSESDFYSDAEVNPSSLLLKCIKCHQKLSSQSNVPSYILPSSDCVICLDNYQCNDSMLGLFCGHSFHKMCIEEWLLSGIGTNQHRCPVCRWPADVKKGKYDIIDTVV